ncbi:hypothetical protein ACFOW1_00090 [Parasediminibacterium paludis]|uniref:TonB-dependent receptor-like protein n=1 Tax=Parasediminibacterium paludis TaxID=908966 RepID=A0ABV8PQY0_9BACT
MKQIYILLLLSVCLLGRAQQIDSMLAIYKNQFQHEKLHLHLDKSVYNNSETIWIKAYLLAGKNPSKYSKTLFIDWYDDNGLLLKHTSQPIFDATARSQFEVPQNYKGQALHLKAYTKWMLNFDTAFIYSKTIRIYNKKNSPKTTPTDITSTLHFFPEGGDLVTGVQSKLAYLATNAYGKPIQFRGAIINSKNELVDSIVPLHDGMGFLLFQPGLQDNYTCNWVDELGNNYSTKLPLAKSNGAILSAQIVKNKIIYAISRSISIADNLKSLHIIATQHQQEIYNAALNLSTKKTVVASIPIDSLPTGIVQLTLFDNNWLPIAERIVFVNNFLHQFFPIITTVKKDVAKRAKNSFEITVSDSLLSNMSVAITDASLANDSSSNIISELLLTDDIKGYVHNPSFYFLGNEDVTKHNLDLVMLTHGWRRYNWNNIVSLKTPNIINEKETDYLQIKGKVFSGGQVSIKPNEILGFILQSKDSSKQYFTTQVKQNGTFELKQLIFYDTTKLFYQFNADKKLNEIGAVSFQNPISQTPLFKNIEVSKTGDIDSAVFASNDSINQHIERLKKEAKNGLLKEVIVNSKVKTAKEILDDKYASGLFKGNNGFAFDVLNDETAKGSLDVFHYLQNQVPGLTMSHSLEPGDTTALTWREGSPEIFLNEMPADAYDVQHIQMTDIAYIKVFRPPFMGASGSGASGAIVIYTRKPDEIKYNGTSILKSVQLLGYTAYKEFYQPDYFVPQLNGPIDARTTLYWNPFVLTDKNNKTFKVDFYNSDVVKKFRIVIEGMNALGQLAHIEKVIDK